MAYGQQPLRPKKSDEKIKPLMNPLTQKIQQGKTGNEGADMEAMRNFGTLPSSGNFEPGAGSELSPGGSNTSGAMKGEGGMDKSSSHAQVIHHSSHGVGAAGKKPLKPGSHGGKGTGSVDTMTKLIFHPKGGLANKTAAVRHSPEKSSGFKDSGQKGPPRKSSGVST